MNETQLNVRRRSSDVEIATLVMSVERLNENILSLSEDQKLMNKELAKIGEVLIKMDHINERYFVLEKRVIVLEDERKTKGCPVVQRLEIENTALKKECDSSIAVVARDVANLDAIVKKISWGTASVVALALSSAFFGLVLK